MPRKILENSFPNNATNPQVAVIKGFMGRPTRLKSVKYSGKSVVVTCRDGKTLAQFANDVVYQYDPEGFKKLCEAFESGDNVRLEEE